MQGRPAAAVVMRIGAALVAVGAVIYALVPFTVAARLSYGGAAVPTVGVAAIDSESSGVPSISAALVAIGSTSSCGAALIDAWHAKSAPSGWFGYAPLSSVPRLAGSQCRAESQRRLWHTSEALLAALALVVVAGWIGRRPGWASGPTTSPAT